IKTCTIIRSKTGKWHACFACEVEAKPLEQNPKEVGIDVGLYSFASLTEGEPIENPRFFRTEEHELAKAQRQLELAPKASKKRRERRKKVARIQERIANKRRDFAHQESRKIINKFGKICIEELKILNMMKNHRLVKSIADAA